GGEALFVARGEGAYGETEDGRRLLDWVQSWGPLVFGHADSETIEAVREAALDGTSFGASTEREVELAEEIVDAVPSVEQVRFVSSGTEAAMSALPLPRPATHPPPLTNFPPRSPPRGGAPRLRAPSPPARPGVPPPGRRADCRRRLQRRRPGRGGGRAAGGGPGGVLRRAGRGEHGLRPAAPGVPRGPPRPRR